MPAVKNDEVCSLIQRAKERAGIASDGQLAARLGLTRAAVSVWQTGRSVPTPEHVLALCELSGDDAAQIMLSIWQGQSLTRRERDFWDSILARLAPPAAKIAVLFAMVFVALTLAPQPAPAAELHATGNLLFYTSYLLALSWRLWVRTRRNFS